MIINNSTGEQIVTEASKRLTVDIDYGIRVYMPIQIIKQFEKITDPEAKKRATKYIRDVYEDWLDDDKKLSEKMKNTLMYCKKSFKDYITAVSMSFTRTGREISKDHVAAWNNSDTNPVRLDSDPEKVFYRMVSDWRRLVGTAETDMDAPVGTYAGNKADKLDKVAARKGTIGPETYKRLKNERKFKINEEAYHELDLSNIERSQDFNEFIYENFDLEDQTTRMVLFAMNEAEQDRVMLSMTSRLYDSIIDKVDDIDFGEIPSTRGDITKLSNYNKLKECMSLMKDMLKHFKEADKPVDILVEAISNIESRTNLWKRCYNLDIEFGMIIYNTIVLAIIESTSYILSMCVDFLKSPTSDSFEIVVDRGKLNKSKNHMLFESLEKFNNSCRKGQLDKAVEGCVKANVKNFSGGVGLTIISVLAIIIAIIPIIKELVFLFYYTRVKASDYFEAQSNLLEINAYNLETGDRIRTGEDAKKIAEKQMAVAARFRKISNAIAVDAKTAESKASTALVNDRKKKAVVDDVVDVAPDAMTSALF